MSQGMTAEEIISALQEHLPNAIVLISKGELGGRMVRAVESPRAAHGWHLPGKATPAVLVFSEGKRLLINDSPSPETVIVEIPRDTAERMKAAKDRVEDLGYTAAFCEDTIVLAEACRKALQDGDGQ